jgi:hypothetical protein
MTIKHENKTEMDKLSFGKTLNFSSKDIIKNIF